MALFLLGITAFLRFFIFVPSINNEEGVFGGPLSGLRLNGGNRHDLAMLVNNAPISLGSQDSEGRSSVPSGMPAASLKDNLNGVLTDNNQGAIITYKAQKGDTASRIAKQFGISLDSLLSANPGISSNNLRVGTELSVLPVSGIVYKVRDGETPISVAAQYGLTLSQIREFNPAVNFSDFGTRTTLVIPGNFTSPASSNTAGDLPDLRGYFIMPTDGYNWGKLHNYNAVDIANACGTAVNAAADGLVVDYGSSPYFNGGYGGFALIEHPNGTKTRYAHLDELSVQLGDYVKQGQKVGTMGNTGNVHGPTGCHLHFEVYGAKNPLAKS